jgi:hypothetical protein
VIEPHEGSGDGRDAAAGMSEGPEGAGTAAHVTGGLAGLGRRNRAGAPATDGYHDALR